MLCPFALWAQNGDAKAPTADQFVGNYKGTAKSPEGDVSLTMEIKSEKGKISGRLVTPQGEQLFTSGEVADGKLRLKFGSAANAGLLALQLRADKVVGEWKTGSKSRPVEFQRVPAPVQPPVAEVKVPPVTAPDPLSGEWDAAADAQGQAVPFTLTLKLEGEKVTGGSSSQLGESTISSGSWKDGKLAGDFDYNGQVQGKWVASRKKP